LGIGEPWVPAASADITGSAAIAKATRDVANLLCM
jgi:hypothetical protein